MLPETVTSLELIRFVVALYGMYVSFKGKATANKVIAITPTDTHNDLFIRSLRMQRIERMNLFLSAQNTFLIVHGLLLTNVIINFGYPSASIEQPNVMSSNIAQILIPLLLSRLSELITSKINTFERIDAILNQPQRDAQQNHPE